MGGGQVRLDQGAVMGGVGQEVDMHLAGAVLVTADENVVGLGQSGAAHQRIDAVEIAAARGATPIMEGLRERGLRADQRRLVGRPPRGSLSGFSLARPHWKSVPLTKRP